MPDQTLSRRHFLKLGAASIAVLGLSGGCERGVRPDRIGLALGGGGARGLAHILVLEVLDELQIRPWQIAGTSIGALMGVAYAAGLTAQVIEDHARSVLSNRLDAARLAFSSGKGGVLDSLV